jgi:ABC-type multidrug transport system fused ATPase/permease subunit
VPHSDPSLTKTRFKRPVLRRTDGEKTSKSARCNMPSIPETRSPPRASTTAQWTALFSFMQKSHGWILALAVISAVCSGLVQPAVAVFTGKFSDAAAQFSGGSIESGELRGRTQSVVRAFIALGCCTLITNAGLFATWTMFGEMQARRVRQELFRSLLEKDLEWFDSRESGTSSLLTRLHTYSSQVCQLFGR